jgi:hypothetical protein
MAVAEEVGMATMSRRRKTDSEMDPSPDMAGPTTVAHPDRERIMLRAYELYLARGAVDGLAEDDWYTAERELGNRDSSSRES